MPKLDSLSDLLLHLLLDALRFIRLSLRPHCALAAENLFLRKQLALYLERKVKARRASDASRLTLVLLSSLFAWRRALTIVQPASSDGIGKAFGCFGGGNRNPEDDREFLPSCKS